MERCAEWELKKVINPTALNFRKKWKLPKSKRGGKEKLWPLRPVDLLNLIGNCLRTLNSAIFLSGFSFTDTDDSQDSRRKGTIFYSTLPLPPAHEHSDIYLQLCTWDDYHIFLIVPLDPNLSSYHRVIEFNPTLSTYHLIDW